MTKNNKDIKISIVICTHNPDMSYLEKLLYCLEKNIILYGEMAEVLLVDNGSKIPLAGDERLSKWLEATACARLLREERLGLSYARARAFSEVRGGIIVCFDDDNAPDDDYLVQALKAMASHPWVGIWGPGNISVEWGAESDAGVKRNCATDFQQLQLQNICYELGFPATNNMPYGTGMVLRKSIGLIYAKKVEACLLKTTGRIGKQLASAEDNQICWLAIQNGWAIGRHPALRLTHMISGHKAQPDYVARLAYGKAKSYHPALREIFPDFFNVRVPRPTKIMIRLIGKTLGCLFGDKTHSWKYQLARTLGFAVGTWNAYGKAPPYWIRALVERLYADKSNPALGSCEKY
jgi:glycosyltransferase involved in cell wall biosynthesis